MKQSPRAIKQMGSGLRGEGVQTCLPHTVINKYKRRRFQKTKNLLTGETEADPEMIKVCGCHQRLEEGRREGHQAGGTSLFPSRAGLEPTSHLPTEG